MTFQPVEYNWTAHKLFIEYFQSAPRREIRRDMPVLLLKVRSVQRLATFSWQDIWRMVVPRRRERGFK